MTYTDVAAQLSEASGRTIRYEPITTHEFFDGMKQAGVPEQYRDLLEYLFNITQSGINAHVSNGIERALGRSPRTFSEFAKRAAAHGSFKTASKEATRG